MQSSLSRWSKISVRSVIHHRKRCPARALTKPVVGPRLAVIAYAMMRQEQSSYREVPDALCLASFAICASVVAAYFATSWVSAAACAFSSTELDARSTGHVG